MMGGKARELEGSSTDGVDGNDRAFLVFRAICIVPGQWSITTVEAGGPRLDLEASPLPPGGITVVTVSRRCLNDAPVEEKVEEGAG